MILSISQLKLLFLKFNNILSARERERERESDCQFFLGGGGGELKTNIKLWRSVSKDIKQDNTIAKWKDMVPYWRGNPSVSPTRKDLLKCNISNKDDWNTCLYTVVNIYIFF